MDKGLYFLVIKQSTWLCHILHINEMQSIRGNFNGEENNSVLKPVQEHQLKSNIYKTI
jgi:hypothetical protein